MASTELMASDAAITPQIIMEEGAGKAYQSVAQSSAIAVQDAVDNLRNINTITTTAIGVAMAQMLATQNPGPPWTSIITNAMQISTESIANFQSIGAAAAQVLKGFPNGQ